MTRWLDYFAIFGTLAAISPIMYQICQSRLNICKIRNKLSKFCQRLVKFCQIWSHWMSFTKFIGLKMPKTGFYKLLTWKGYFIWFTCARDRPPSRPTCGSRTSNSGWNAAHAESDEVHSLVPWSGIVKGIEKVPNDKHFIDEGSIMQENFNNIFVKLVFRSLKNCWQMNGLRINEHNFYFYYWAKVH